MEERLDRVLAHLGLGTRKEVGKLIRAGAVRVDGAVVRDRGYKLDPEAARIEVRGEPVRYARHFYVLLHKPAGVLTATRSERETTVLDLLPDALWRDDLRPVGRLDRDTEGLLLLTNHGELLHRLTHPRWKVAKVYFAELASELPEDAARRFAEGVLDFAPAELEALGPRAARVTLYEGKHRQVRRMFAALGAPVAYLRRERFGPLELGGLEPGQARPLRAAEAAALLEAVGLA
ncbi:ribosomal small subunit pseudouridine synthase A [Oceanithermus profundus DSM 14977]|uniref:Pseudouridine synthase n=1 Tax=Oceanithermus profundus (strain DSM 14977 / NBRC 100410 / VKM B-2274 / 506) TaxID=670487 RepID=E4U6B3_OCEP5|nr:pseudouridine synthase [Oceanithermus profundus]ADR35533.1 ribosomal small subunit pseudouridine synthase A [Oceanithermus profundus DSM 14977]